MGIVVEAHREVLAVVNGLCEQLGTLGQTVNKTSLTVESLKQRQREPLGMARGADGADEIRQEVHDLAERLRQIEGGAPSGAAEQALRDAPVVHKELDSLEELLKTVASRLDKGDSPEDDAVPVHSNARSKPEATVHGQEPGEETLRRSDATTCPKLHDENGLFDVDDAGDETCKPQWMARAAQLQLEFGMARDIAELGRRLDSMEARFLNKADDALCPGKLREDSDLARRLDIVEARLQQQSDEQSISEAKEREISEILRRLDVMDSKTFPRHDDEVRKAVLSIEALRRDSAQCWHRLQALEAEVTGSDGRLGDLKRFAQRLAEGLNASQEVACSLAFRVEQLETRPPSEGAWTLSPKELGAGQVAGGLRGYIEKLDAFGSPVLSERDEENPVNTAPFLEPAETQQELADSLLAALRRTEEREKALEAEVERCQKVYDTISHRPQRNLDDLFGRVQELESHAHAVGDAPKPRSIEKRRDRPVDAVVPSCSPVSLFRYTQREPTSTEHLVTPSRADSTTTASGVRGFRRSHSATSLRAPDLSSPAAAFGTPVAQPGGRSGASSKQPGGTHVLVTPPTVRQTYTPPSPGSTCPSTPTCPRTAQRREMSCPGARAASRRSSSWAAPVNTSNISHPPPPLPCMPCPQPIFEAGRRQDGPR
eukprot:TRINITY_DN49247_c0_g2_i2.p1 TRINITY_DN49247_c0_g2~~TRINITY_DN49247_c0_g2_i2.p1  ORF type:complete len:657 (+),score=113.65 TRINITY_DN49247_c0_g2_i2:140-2110(+)